jgi:WD40 repeat protein
MAATRVTCDLCWLLLAIATAASAQAQIVAEEQREAVTTVQQASEHDTAESHLERINCVLVDTNVREPTWVGFSEKSPYLLVRSAALRGFDIGGLRVWNYEKGEIASREDLSHPGGLVGLPYAAQWSSTKEGLCLREMPNGEKRVHQIDVREPLTDIVAGSISRSVVVERRDDGSVLVVDIAAGKIVRELKTETLIEAVALSSDGTLLATCGVPLDVWNRHDVSRNDFSSVIIVLEIANGRQLLKWRAGYRVFSTAFSPSDNQLAFGGGFDTSWKDSEGHFDIVQLKNSQWSRHYQTSSRINTLCFFDENRVALGLREGRLLVIDVEDQSELAAVMAHDGGVTMLAKKGELLASCGRDGKVCIWEYRSHPAVPAGQ